MEENFVIENENIEESDQTSGYEQQSPEVLQKKLYFFLDHLKKFHGALPE